ncbi:MAG: hypothetical protein NC321_12060 [Clostridium sp.]|nr:hypothetical protein [Clostridium sp.]
MKLLADTKEPERMLPKIIHTGCCCVLLALYIFFTLQKGYFIIAYGTPRELREMTGIAVARQFAYGHNPYALSALEHNIPAVTSIYGILVPLLMSPFIRLFSVTPLSALQICQLLTLIVEVTGAVFFYHLLFIKTKNQLLSLIGMLLFQTCYWRYSSFGGAFPDQWGLTVSVIFMTLLYIDERRKRYRPLLYAVIMVSLFYMKQYFVLILIGLCVYLFLRSKKDCMKMIFYGILTGCLSILIIHTLFPLYFSEVFPIAQGQTLTGDSAYSAAQIVKLSLYYGPVVLFAIVGILYNICRMIKYRRLCPEMTYELCQTVFIFLPLFHIAENQGTNYTYYLQLWYPYIILLGLVSASELLKWLFSQSAAQILATTPPRKFCFPKPVMA